MNRASAPSSPDHDDHRASAAARSAAACSAFTRDPDPRSRCRLGAHRTPAEGAVDHPRGEHDRRPGSTAPAAPTPVLTSRNVPLFHGRAEPRAVLFDALGTLLSFGRPRRTCAPSFAPRGVASARHGGAHGDPGRDRVLPRPPPEGRDARRWRFCGARCTAAMGGAARAAASMPRDLDDSPAARDPAVLPLPRRPRRRWGPARAAACASSSSPTGTSRCTSGSPRPGSRRCSTARSPRRRSAPPSRTRRLPRALELAGAAAPEAWHAGDSPAADVEGALAAGLTPVLVGARRRAPRRPACAGCGAATTSSRLLMSERPAPLGSEPVLRPGCRTGCRPCACRRRPSLPSRARPAAAVEAVDAVRRDARSRWGIAILGAALATLVVAATWATTSARATRRRA